MHQQTKRQRKNFGSWQSEQRWNWRVVSATIPELPPPEIIHAGRERCELRLSSSYERRKHDDRPFGFEVQFEQTTPPDKTLGEVAAWGPGDEKGTQRFDAASHRQEKHETVFANHKSYIVDVKDTLPARGYVFRVRVYYGEVEGPWSKPSSEANTPARGAPSKIVGSSVQAMGRGLTLTVPRPFDDGGSAIKGLVLRFRHHDSENFPGAWRHVGSFATKDWPLQLDVTNELLTSREDSSHNHSYEFSVAPYNRLGVAPWSGPTAPCATNNEEKATSFGLGPCGNQISGAPRHRRDAVPITASARWRKVSTPSTRRCSCDGVT